ncbi:MAG: hypothetical protein ACI936_001164 [Paraglaciecola sp.]|jgi:hypothetical protein
MYADTLLLTPNKIIILFYKASNIKVNHTISITYEFRASKGKLGFKELKV